LITKPYPQSWLGLDMQRWFLSYNSQDLALMQGLEAALKHKNPEAKIFFAPTSLRAGGFWLPELAKSIAEATAFVLLVGEKGLGAWQAIEYYEALDRRVKQQDFSVILVLLDGQPAPGLPFLRQLHWIISANPASEQSIGQIVSASAGGGALPGELWRHTAPYRGLAAMETKDSDYFFGRGRETVEVIRALEAAPDKTPVLLGNSGVGKSSLAQAGALAAVLRQAWPETAMDPGAWPQAFKDSRAWCVLTLKPGVEPVRELVKSFIRTWQFDPTDPRRETRENQWTDSLIAGHGTLRGLLDATEERLQEQGRSRPPAFLLYVDQGEELYVRAEERQRRRFSEVLAQGLPDRRLRVLMSLRADFFGDLQKDEPLYSVHRLISVPPLREAQLLEVVSKPANLLGARFETGHLAKDIAQRAAEESSRDAGALPLLSYLLDDMWKSKDPKWDGVLRLPAPAIELGRVLVDRANAFIATHPDSEAKLRRIFTLKLATVHEDAEPTRRRAFRGEFSGEEWLLVNELADHPNRLLVTAIAETPTAETGTASGSDAARLDANVAPAAGETYAEVAHEAIFKRWDRLKEWIASEREFLAWRSGLEAARRAWAVMPKASKQDALLMGAALTQAQSWSAKRAEDLPAPDRKFIAQSIARETKAQARARLIRSLIYLLLVGMIVGLVGWINQRYINEQINWYVTLRPYAAASFWPHVLTPQAESALQTLQSFRECAQDCPEMIAVPAGEYTMGSPAAEPGRNPNEGPQHKIVVSKRFAVSKNLVTFADWDACERVGSCPRAADVGWERGRQPVIHVSWNDAQQYIGWLAKMTGRPYRLLTEAEWEYAARAGTTTAYYWGDAVGTNNANCNGCGSQWDNQHPSPVGTFNPNAFGLYDMAGNVFEWVQDCYNDNYNRAPTDASAWTSGDCIDRVVRGGSWNTNPNYARSAFRNRNSAEIRFNYLGFRVARSLGQ
jgi:formylglycine-generating enzyme required for sulfatase activity